MERKDKFELWKSSFIPILVTFLLIYLIEAVFSRNIYSGVVPTGYYDKLPRSIGEIPITGTQGNTFNIMGIDLDTSIITNSIILSPIIALITGGLFAAFYKKIYENEDVTISSIFILFRENLLRNVIISILVNILVGLGTLLLIVPGIIINLGLYSWPLLAIDIENNDKNAIEILKMSWNVTKGKKGMIFIKVLKWVIIAGIIQLIPLSLLFFIATGAPAITNIGIALVLIFVAILLGLLTNTITAMRDIEVAYDLVESHRVPYREYVNSEYIEEDNRFNDFEVEIEKEDEDRW